jgi:hypothetical protein
MAVNLLSFPFRLRPNGQFATVVQDSEDHHAEEIAAIVMTIQGERDLVPDFGISDPSFDTVHEGEIISQVQMFEVPVDIKSVRVDFPNESTEYVTIDFE